MTDNMSMYHQAQEEQKINLNFIIICAAEANTRDELNILQIKKKVDFFAERIKIQLF
jgi:hypothetical protein